MNIKRFCIVFQYKNAIYFGRTKYSLYTKYMMPFYYIIRKITFTLRYIIYIYRYNPVLPIHAFI